MGNRSQKFHYAVWAQRSRKTRQNEHIFLLLADTKQSAGHHKLRCLGASSQSRDAPDFTGAATMWRAEEKTPANMAKAKTPRSRKEAVLIVVGGRQLPMKTLSGSRLTPYVWGEGRRIAPSFWDLWFVRMEATPRTQKQTFGAGFRRLAPISTQAFLRDPGPLSWPLWPDPTRNAQYYAPRPCILPSWPYFSLFLPAIHGTLVHANLLLL
jgi:hypothetical protein